MTTPTTDRDNDDDAMTGKCHIHHRWIAAGESCPGCDREADDLDDERVDADEVLTPPPRGV